MAVDPGKHHEFTNRYFHLTKDKEDERISNPREKNNDFVISIAIMITSDILVGYINLSLELSLNQQKASKIRSLGASVCTPSFVPLFLNITTNTSIVATSPLDAVTSDRRVMYYI